MPDMGIGEMLLIGAMAASAGSAVSTAVSASQKDGPDLLPPPDAQAGEKSAQDAGQRARRKTLMALGANQGRSSTILTGGKLGELASPAQGGKTLLGA